MRQYRFAQFGLENLKLEPAPEPRPGPGEALLDVRALSLNFRDLLVLRGHYNPKLRLPATPVSDAAGNVLEVGPGVSGVRAGDAVMTHFLPDWVDGPYRMDYLRTTLGTPGPGLAAERVVLPARALLPLPAGYDFAAAATLPIAALTAWSALHAGGDVGPGSTVLTLGTGGVSIFALQLAHALGARVIITSSRDEKLARTRSLGDQETINYRAHPDWEKLVLERTGGAGADLTVETVGGATLNRSLTATRAGGTIAVLGALAGLSGELNVAALMMKRVTIAGIMVGPRRQFEDLLRFLEQHRIRPVIDRALAFEQLPEALRLLESGEHVGKIVLTR
jgi:NADPH:quinone reductase-like Zn-dependent oxidoreductase